MSQKGISWKNLITKILTTTTIIIIIIVIIIIIIIIIIITTIIINSNASLQSRHLTKEMLFKVMLKSIWVIVFL